MYVTCNLNMTISYYRCTGRWFDYMLVLNPVFSLKKEGNMIVFPAWEAFVACMAGDVYLLFGCFVAGAYGVVLRCRHKVRWRFLFWVYLSGQKPSTHVPKFLEHFVINVIMQYTVIPYILAHVGTCGLLFCKQFNEFICWI